MIQNISFKEAGKEDVNSIFLLIKGCFDKYVAVDYKEEGIQEFYKHINPANLLMRIKEGYYTFIALMDGTIIGVIQFKEAHHISLFFVAKEYQGKGIGKALFESSLKGYILKNNHHDLITVNSTPIAVKFYEKIGFRRTMFEQTKNGIIYTPMELILLE